MHRVLALLLIPVLTATPGATSAYTHIYRDHDHPEHRHGLSAHRHYGLPAHPDAVTTRLEGCEPGDHTVSFAFVCTAPPQVHHADADVDQPTSLTRVLQLEPVGIRMSAFMVRRLARKPRLAPRR